MPEFAALDTFALDTQTLDGGLSMPAGSTDSITFEDFGLQNSNIVITELNEDSGPLRKIVRSSTPGSDGQIIESDRFPQKVITAKGVVTDTTAALMEARLDEMKKFLRIQNGTLKVTKIGGEIRIYKATVQNMDKIFAKRGRRITSCIFEIQFLCTEPFGKSEDRVVNSYFDKTVASFDFEIEHTGNYDSSPIFFLAIDAEDALAKVVITNNTTGKSIEVEPSGGFSSGDLLEINTEEKIVKINSVEVDFNGFFFELEPGGNSITIDSTSTSHSITITEKHFVTYL